MPAGNKPRANARRHVVGVKEYDPGQGSKGINFSGWHGLDMSVTVTKRR